jgi:dCMP deaminase
MESKVGPRKDALSWDDYFMSIAFLSSMRSKDPSTQVGACIVNAHNRIVGMGYNGFPAGCKDHALPWAREGDTFLDTKYPFVCHAEVNAILNKCEADIRGSRIYVALFPCNECAKMIIQSGISEVIFMDDKYHDTDHSKAARILFEMSGVSMRHYTPVCKEIIISLG